VQLIAGKTVVQNMGGSPKGAAALKSLKPGQLIVVQGKTNVERRDSLTHWVTKQSFDIVVHSFQILQETDAQQQQVSLLEPPARPKLQASVLGVRPV
jgi:aspartyl/asparaginyl-tRNA synthetase